MRRRPTVLLLLAGLLTAAPARAQDAPPPCSAPEHRQFDFWIGEWEVTNPAGELAGHNRIRPDYGGCVLREAWTGARGLTGSSFNIYDARTGRWHQTWVDSSGTLLLLDGGLRGDGAMVLEGERRSAEGGTERHRITWTPVGPREVRQLWEVSTDGGGSWRIVFDGRYRKTGGG